METIWSLLGSELVFWFCALSGTALFAIQLILNLLGTSNEEIGGEDLDAGTFKWLSIQAITGFLMMFGWIGLTCKKEFHLSLALTIILALFGGFISIFAIGSIFRFAQKLKSSGTVFRVEDAIGKEATVYHRIPKIGSGKITLTLNSLSYEIDAISQNGAEIPSFAQVQIIKKIDEKTVLVTRCL